ncbi:hypothetical protein DFJ74DRAFT_491243 [Hyaloraphidium curvatum]|nr:hypothetical protein DFJ74DRAFT_491243 [Hyaloraphidium curvatum]
MVVVSKLSFETAATAALACIVVLLLAVFLLGGHVWMATQSQNEVSALKSTLPPWTTIVHVPVPTNSSGLIRRDVPFSIDQDAFVLKARFDFNNRNLGVLIGLSTSGDLTKTDVKVRVHIRKETTSLLCRVGSLRWSEIWAYGAGSPWASLAISLILTPASRQAWGTRRIFPTTSLLCRVGSLRWSEIWAYGAGSPWASLAISLILTPASRQAWGTRRIFPSTSRCTSAGVFCARMWSSSPGNRGRSIALTWQTRPGAPASQQLSLVDDYEGKGQQK